MLLFKTFFILFIPHFCVVTYINAAEIDRWTYVGAVYEHRPFLANIQDPWTDIEKNLKVYEEQAQIAAQKGAEIIVFPEDGIFGLTMSRNEIFPYLEIVEDPEQVITNPCIDSIPSARNRIQRRLSCAAQWNQIYIVANFGTVVFCASDELCPKDGRFQYNTNVVFDSEGNIVARYHKQNLFYEEQFDVPPKVEWSIFGGRFGNFGTFTCFDILFKEPAVDILEQVGVVNVAFTTAWRNVMPEMFTLGFHESFAVRMGINLLSAELHLPEFRFQGSAIYSSQNGALSYYNSDKFLSPGKLVIANITTPPIGPVETSINFPDSGNNFSPKESFTSFMQDNAFTFVLLDQSKLEDELYLEVNETKCYLKYKVKRVTENEIYGFGIFDALHLSSLDSYIQVCALVRCANNSRYSCGQKTKEANTTFEILTLSGKFSGHYIFPALLVEGANPAKMEWDFHLDKKNFKGEITSQRLSKPLVSAMLLTRLYERDGNNLTKDYTNPNFEIKENNEWSKDSSQKWYGQLANKDSIGVLVVGDMAQLGDNSLSVGATVGIVFAVGFLTVCFIIIIVLKYKKRANYIYI